MLTKVRKFCHTQNVFRFRGRGGKIGERGLELPKTAAALFDEETRSKWLDVRDSRAGPSKIYRRPLGGWAKWN